MVINWKALAGPSIMSNGGWMLKGCSEQKWGTLLMVDLGPKSVDGVETGAATQAMQTQPDASYPAGRGSQEYRQARIAPAAPPLPQDPPTPSLAAWQQPPHLKNPLSHQTGPSQSCVDGDKGSAMCYTHEEEPGSTALGAAGSLRDLVQLSRLIHH